MKDNLLYSIHLAALGWREQDVVLTIEFILELFEIEVEKSRITVVTRRASLATVA